MNPDPNFIRHLYVVAATWVVCTVIVAIFQRLRRPAGEFRTKRSLLRAVICVPILLIIAATCANIAWSDAQLQFFGDRVEAEYIGHSGEKTRPYGGIYTAGRTYYEDGKVVSSDTYIDIQFQYRGRKRRASVTHSSRQFPLGKPGQKMTLQFLPREDLDAEQDAAAASRSPIRRDRFKTFELLAEGKSYNVLPRIIGWSLGAICLLVTAAIFGSRWIVGQRIPVP